MGRALQLLDCFGDVQEWPLQALAQHLGLPLSTTHRLLKLCSAEGFITSDGKGVLPAGTGAVPAGRRTFARFFRSARLPCRCWNGFTAEFAETALLTLLDRPALQMFFAARTEPKVPMRLRGGDQPAGPVGMGVPRGRVLLAYLSEAEIATVNPASRALTGGWQRL